MSKDFIDLFAAGMSEALVPVWAEIAPMISDVPFPPENLIFHYTSLDAAIGIIENQELWLSNISFLNDTNELLCARNVLTNLEKLWPELSEIPRFLDLVKITLPAFEMNAVNSPFITSFCENGDLLGQWRGYGNGVSIAFDAENTAISFEGAFLKKVIYDVNTQAHILKRILVTANKYLSSLVGKDDLQEELVNALLLVRAHILNLAIKMKNSAFQEEREWRVVFTRRFGMDASEDPPLMFRQRGRGVVPFIKLRPKSGRLPIRGVTISPSADPSLTLAIRALLDKHKYNDAFVRSSDIPFRD